MKIRKALTVLLLLVLAVSLTAAGTHQVNSFRGKRDYDEAARLAAVPQMEDAPAVPQDSMTLQDPNFALLEEVDLDSLQEINEDVRGWICIPGTGLSYPVMQSEDNQYYLNHTWLGEENPVGSIFLECQASGDFSDYATLIYGHRMINGTMFGVLREYKKIEFWRQHPSVYLVSGDGTRRYDIYAAFEAELESPVYRLAFPKRKDKEEFVAYGLENSVINTEVKPTMGSRILTLSTCTGRGHGRRWVVQAVEKK